MRKCLAQPISYPALHPLPHPTNSATNLIPTLASFPNPPHRTRQSLNTAPRLDAGGCASALPYPTRPQPAGDLAPQHHTDKVLTGPTLRRVERQQRARARSRLRARNGKQVRLWGQLCMVWVLVGVHCASARSDRLGGVGSTEARHGMMRCREMVTKRLHDRCNCCETCVLCNMCRAYRYVLWCYILKGGYLFVRRVRKENKGE